MAWGLVYGKAVTLTDFLPSILFPFMARGIGDDSFFISSYFSASSEGWQAVEGGRGRTMGSLPWFLSQFLQSCCSTPFTEEDGERRVFQYRVNLHRFKFLSLCVNECMRMRLSDAPDRIPYSWPRKEVGYNTFVSLCCVGDTVTPRPRIFQVPHAGLCSLVGLVKATTTTLKGRAFLSPACRADPSPNTSPAPTCTVPSHSASRQLILH